MSTKILIGADIVPTQSNMDLFCSGNIDELLGSDLKNYLNEADYIILNLEAPYIDDDHPIVKAGANMRAPRKAFEGVKKIDPYFFGLANNHILDHGQEGLFSTMQLLEENGIAYTGAGKNLDEASKPYIANVNGLKVGIYACAEHEYSIAQDDKAGANPYDPLYSFDHVRELRKQCDYVIVLYHGGKEYYRYPTPMLQKVFRKFAEVGADLVVAQHTHCIGCYEKFMDSTLVYGQGNFLFDDGDREEEKTSLLIEVDISDENHEEKFVPLIKYKNVVRLALDIQRGDILSDYELRSKNIIDKSFIYEEFIKLALSYRRTYLLGLAGGFSRILPIRVLCKLLGDSYVDHYYSNKRGLPADNFINCETHRELVQESIRLIRK